MQRYSLTHVTDAALLRDLADLVRQDRATTAALLAHVAEVDARRLYAPAGYSSMHAYCVEDLKLSEDAASKRIQAARAARRFPGLFEALVEGKLHLTAICLLAPHLTLENCEELIRAASGRRKAEIEIHLARMAGRSLRAGMVRVLPAAAQHALAHAGDAPKELETGEHALAHVAGESGPGEHALAHVGDIAETTGLPSERYMIQAVVDGTTHEKLRYAQALLSHTVPNGDIARVLDRALDSLIAQLERRKFGITAHPGRKRAALRKRCIPAHVRRAVWERDQGRCTFVGATGKRCDSRRFLEFDHVEPVAHGGTATLEGIRLRCRTHNQLEADRVFGSGFMSRKRGERPAPCRPEVSDLRRSAGADEPGSVTTVEDIADVLAALRSLGCRAQDARRAAEHAARVPCATIEERLRVALKFIGAGHVQSRRVGVIPAPTR